MSREVLGINHTTMSTRLPSELDVCTFVTKTMKENKEMATPFLKPLVSRVTGLDGNLRFTLSLSVGEASITL